MQTVKEAVTALTQKQLAKGFKLEGVYTYKDAESKPVYYRIRMKNPETGEKWIRPLWFDGAEWKLAEPEGIKPLYGLPAVLEHRKEYVWVVEGENKVRALEGLGVVAVTSGAASSAKGSDWSVLDGRNVIIWPDNDDPGKRYGEAVYKILLEEFRTTAKIIDVAKLGLEVGGDCVNWLEAHPNATVDDLFSLSQILPVKSEVVASINGLDSGEEKEPSHLEYSDQVVEKIGRNNLIFSENAFWLWDTSLWGKADERQVRRIIHETLSRKKVMRSKVDSILDIMKTELFRKDFEFDTKKGLINCLNGTLELSQDKEEWFLREHRREDYLTTCIPVNYNQEAECPRFMQFLDEIFAKDNDRADKIKMVCEALGYTLTTETHMERFILLIGAGANGKSVLLSLVEALCGKKNTSAVCPDQFDNQFQRAHLQGKLANIVTEIAEGAEINDASLKTIVSGELTTAEHKGKPPFDFHPYATCWFGTNHMPRTKDFSNALFRRATIIQFNEVFSEDIADKGLKLKLAQEAPGILNVALKHYTIANKRGWFTECESSIAARKAWALESDQVALFASEELERDPDVRIPSSIMFERYKEWARVQGINKTVHKNTLTARLKRLDFDTGHSGKVRQFLGVRFKLPPMDPTLN